jgi:hypothetical protein
LVRGAAAKSEVRVAMMQDLFGRLVELRRQPGIAKGGQGVGGNHGLIALSNNY